MTRKFSCFAIDSEYSRKFFAKGGEIAILTPKNEIVQEINDRLLSLFPVDEKKYLSSNNLCHSDFLHNDFDESLYSPDVLNGLKPPGLPLYKLVLKVGVPVMLLRNIDQKAGLCNRTRLLVLALGNHVVEAEIISGSNIGTRTFIPRMSLTPSDKRISFTFQRRQFPLAVCFAMTINKSQDLNTKYLDLIWLHFTIPSLISKKALVLLSVLSQSKSHSPSPERPSTPVGGVV
ncbi:hypothetical protein LXL04_038458 [Taraxacum kok-saghyz]